MILSGTSESPDNLQYRWLELRDLEQCTTLEVASHSHPWSEAQIRSALQRYHCLGLELNAQLAAYAVVSCVCEEAELLDLVVAPDFRRRALGSALLRRILHWLREEKRSQRIFLEVRQSNYAARALYEETGFVETGLRIGYYPANPGREDAILMAMELL